uniref:Peptidase S1 domain-containing protein n=1 Tax=Leptobrachium leishanense TaxID=445787 RepID=A0A8C5WJ77_9ANUR
MLQEGNQGRSPGIPYLQLCIMNTASSSSPACGVPAISGRIVGGTDAVYGEWPWQVAVTTANSLCGGSLINEQWVLSAAHCFDKYKFGESIASSVTVVVEKFTKHPNFIKPGDRGDIALVKLKSPVTFTNYIRPICLPNASVTFPSGMECWVTGWGTRRYGENLPSINTLQEVMTPLIDYKQCDQMYHIDSSTSSYTIIIQEDKICSGYAEGGKDSCQGDSGGPLVCEANGTWIQAGIVSWGDGCALKNHPGVYTLVPAYESWIKSYISDVKFVSDDQISGSPDLAPAPGKMFLLSVFIFIHFVQAQINKVLEKSLFLPDIRCVRCFL